MFKHCATNTYFLFTFSLYARLGKSAVSRALWRH